MHLYFQRTVASLFQAVADLSIVREQALAHLLQTYEAQQEASRCPDRTLLTRARTLLEERLQHIPLDRELAVLGHITYRNLGAWHEEITLLRRYLSTPSLNQDEQAWARWHIVDCLSLAGDAQISVEEQHALFRWATNTFPLVDCFFVLADGTQARSWSIIGRGDDWFRLSELLFKQAPHTASNRLDRFYFLRTAVHLALGMGETERLHHALNALHALLREAALWSEGHWVAVEISTLELTIAAKNGEGAKVRALAQQATTVLQEWEPHLNPHEQEEVKRFRSLCHNVAAPLYQARQYDLAIPLFQKAIAYHTNPHYTYLWLAASLWQTTHQRERIIPYLQQAAARFDGEGNPWDTFQRLPEFEDVRHDPAFLAATNVSWSSN